MSKHSLDEELGGCFHSVMTGIAIGLLLFVWLIASFCDCVGGSDPIEQIYFDEEGRLIYEDGSYFIEDHETQVVP